MAAAVAQEAGLDVPEGSPFDDLPEPGGWPVSGGRGLSVQLLTIAGLATLPSITWLVEGILPAGGDALMYGKPGTFKSLLAVDLACAVATGRPWHGRPTHLAPVVYIAGEGRHGLKARFDAYQDHHGLDNVDGVYIVPEPLSLLNPANAPALLTALAQILPGDANERPLLLIVDTVRKCTPGGEENDSGMVSDALVFLDRLRRDYSMLTVLMLHHPGTAGDRPRGSSAWEADTDTVLKAERESSELRLTLKCEKQRDSEPFEPLLFEVREHAASLVLEGGGQVRDRRTLTSGERRILQALDDQRPEAVSWTRWQGVAETAVGSMSRARKRLLELGYVKSEGPPRSLRYSITGEGIAVLCDFHTSTSFQESSTEVLPSTKGGLVGPRMEVGMDRTETTTTLARGSAGAVRDTLAQDSADA